MGTYIFEAVEALIRWHIGRDVPDSKWLPKLRAVVSELKKLPAQNYLNNPDAAGDIAEYLKAIKGVTLSDIINGKLKERIRMFLMRQRWAVQLSAQDQKKLKAALRGNIFFANPTKTMREMGLTPLHMPFGSDLRIIDCARAEGFKSVPHLEAWVKDEAEAKNAEPKTRKTSADLELADILPSTSARFLVDKLIDEYNEDEIRDISAAEAEAGVKAGAETRYISDTEAEVIVPQVMDEVINGELELHNVTVIYGVCCSMHRFFL